MKKEGKDDFDFSSIDWNSNNYFISNNKESSRKLSNDYDENDINKPSNDSNNYNKNSKKSKKNKKKKNKKKKNSNNNNNNINNKEYQNIINNNINNTNNFYNPDNLYYFKDPPTTINNNQILNGNMLNYNSNFKIPFSNNNISLQNSIFINNQNNVNNINPLNNSFNFNINNNISYTYININNPNSNNINNNYIIPYNNNKNSIILSQLNFNSINKNYNFYNKIKPLDSPRNKIHFENILRQKDKRTTIIIRHIPNKYSIKLLTDELNVNYKDKYDLIYLPIDSINLCNLGFGFINFTFNMHIISFYDEYYGKKWLKFNSEKHCELAYAKIQGKESLLKHVKQNSNFNNEKGIPIYYLNNNIQPTLVKIPSKYLAAFLNFYPYATYKNDNGYFIVESF
jgi:hypothetical protein